AVSDRAAPTGGAVAPEHAPHRLRARDRGGDDRQRRLSTRDRFRRRALPGKGPLLCVLSMASQVSRARSLRYGGPRAGERPRMDDCAAAPAEEFAGGELPRASGRAAAGKPRNVFSIGRRVHVGGGGASVTCGGNRRIGAVTCNHGGIVNRLYTSPLVTRVLVAVMGLGSIASVAIVAAMASGDARPSLNGVPGCAPAPDACRA